MKFWHIYGRIWPLNITLIPNISFKPFELVRPRDDNSFCHKNTTSSTSYLFKLSSEDTFSCSFAWNMWNFQTSSRIDIFLLLSQSLSKIFRKFLDLEIFCVFYQFWFHYIPVPLLLKLSNSFFFWPNFPNSDLGKCKTQGWIYL